MEIYEKSSVMQKEQQVQRTCGQNNIGKLEYKKQGRGENQEIKLKKQAETRSQGALHTTEKDKINLSVFKLF